MKTQRQSSLDQTTNTVRPNLRSGSQLQPIDNGRIAAGTNTYDQSIAPPSRNRAVKNAFNETQDRDNDGLTPIRSEPQDEHHIHVEEEQADTTIDSEHPRDLMASNITRVVVAEENKLPLALS